MPRSVKPNGVERHVVDSGSGYGSQSMTFKRPAQARHFPMHGSGPCIYRYYLIVLLMRVCSGRLCALPSFLPLFPFTFCHFAFVFFGA